MIAHWRQVGLVIALLIAFPMIASAEQGIPSKATLDAMGLSGLQVMSDEEGLAVRGQGFALAGGLSWAYTGTPGILPNAASINLSVAGPSFLGLSGTYYASQVNESHADELNIDVTGVVIYPDGTMAISGTANYRRVSAGGFSKAKVF